MQYASKEMAASLPK